MWATVSLLLCVACLWQGLAHGDPITTPPAADDDYPSVVDMENDVNIVKDPHKGSILATLERMQQEQDQLRQDMQLSQARFKALVQTLQDENALLTEQQQNIQIMALETISNMRQEMGEDLHEMGQQVQRQVMELVKMVGEVMRQQAEVVEQSGLMQGVLDVVQEREREAHKVAFQLTQVQDRLASFETKISQLEVNSNDHASELTAVQQRVDSLESLLRNQQGGQSSVVPSSTPSTTPSTVPTTAQVTSTEPTTTPTTLTEPTTTPMTPTESTTTPMTPTEPTMTRMTPTEPTTPMTPTEPTTIPMTPTEPTTNPMTSAEPTSPMTSSYKPTDAPVMQLLFTVRPDTRSSHNSLITSILVTRGGKLVVGDHFAGKLEMSSLDSPAVVEATYDLHRPWDMLELQDETVAVTMEDQHEIAVFSVSSFGLRMVRNIPTEDTYFAIAQGPDDTLIVSNRRSITTHIDVINMQGEKVRTLFEDAMDLIINPFCLRSFGDDVYVSDWTTSRVFRLNVHTGEVKFTIGDLDLSDLQFNQPRKMDIDDSGNLYITTGGRVCNPNYDGYYCVIQVTPTGSWQVMHDFVPQNQGMFPYGVEVTSSQIIISWCTWNNNWFSELTAYSLPQPYQESATENVHSTNLTGLGEENIGSSVLTNVALNKPALQSTYHPTYGHPEKAVDGSKSTSIAQCTHTADVDNNPNRWWRVDLMGLFEVSAVVITNRGDCCGFRLTNFDIYVMQTLLDPTDTEHDPKDLCLHSNEQIEDGATIRLECRHPIVGQYVSLVLRTDSWPLHFCEIEVLGKPVPVLTNVALNKPALQSTYHPTYGHPEKAVDGSKSTSIAQCTHTADVDNNPNRWWRVDLMGLFEVSAVVITNRGDCCGFRLTNFDIYVMQTLLDPTETEHDPKDLCLHSNEQIEDGATIRLECRHPIVGQYVSLVLRTDSWPLHFCEIEVLGKPSPALTNVALNKPALQSTYHPTYGHPEKAVDGSKSTSIAQCTHTADVDNNPNRWWRVDLMGLFEVSAVVITNRGDCCGFRLTNFDIYVMQTLLDPTETEHDPKDLCLHSNEQIEDGATIRLECRHPIVGQYVSLVLRTDSWPLHFCEIEVLGKPSPALTNVALNKPALQSTYHPSYGHPEKAVDGSKSTSIAQCTHTADVDNNPNRWWRVDLMGLFEVSAVVITNRGDCCGFRLTNFDIYVMQTLLDPTETEHDPKDLCLHSNEQIEDGATIRLECRHPIVGQYVSLVLRTDSWPLHFCEIEVLGKPSSALTNVALNKPALQSTYHPSYGHPEKAVDGSQSTSIAQCTHTADVDSNPNRWWRVDLMGLFEVSAVVITNRGDCCGFRLTNFDIYVVQTLLDSTETDHDSKDLCLHSNEQIEDGATIRLECHHPIVGQYVSLVLRTDSWPLHFCEIEVLGKPSSALTNVALNKPALQSSYHPSYGHPEKAVDGSRSTSIAQCTHTADVDNNPNRWWRVDLMGLFEVSAVVITNRGDCCGFRLTNFDIYVMQTLLDPTETEHDPKDLCLHSNEQIEDGATIRLECRHPIVGQYVSLVLRTDSWPLHFCEIEVLGKPAPALTNVALNKPALQSSYHPSYGHPEKAVDGSKSTSIAQCTHTADVDNNPNRWWRVDLMGLFEVSAVVITNRGDCCGFRLTNFDIYVMQTLLDPTETEHDPKDLCLHSNEQIEDGATIRLECRHPIVGQYVSLVLRTDSWPLHFCEIEVLGKPSSALTNVALNKPALQSTYHPSYGHPEKAVDGSQSTSIAQCTHTADVDNNPNRWWRVDLMGLFEVSAVVITNRGDCCGFRLTNFDIYVVQTLLDSTETDHDSKDLCLHSNEQIEDGATIRLECHHPIVGQYVSLVLRTDSWPLHFCEIEVLGKPSSVSDGIITDSNSPASTSVRTDSNSPASTSVRTSETTPPSSSSQSASASTPDSTFLQTTEPAETTDYVYFYY
ncbi:uncharacterized protein LOC143299363 isoform X2 [Babylonia areolata]|uniref:uncharacterized protein LOC143299363 isoform X2 n=1 Tax=Babylonia areolata TaxID=304850 RepID=UPI003FD18819